MSDEGRAILVADGAPAPAGAGLVSTSKTSPTGRRHTVSMGRGYARVRRCARAVRHFADLAEDQAVGERVRRLLVTLTYRPDVSWSARHLSEFVEAVRAWVTRRGFAFLYLAVAELQKRGAVHYHIVLWLPASLRLPHPDKRGWWRHGMSNVIRVERPVAYVAKYLGKLETDCSQFPKGLRLYSCGGLVRSRRLWRSWLMLPRYVREMFTVECDVQRVSGGFVARATGEFLRSRWRLDSHAPDWSWVQFSEVEQ